MIQKGVKFLDDAKVQDAVGKRSRWEIFLQWELFLIGKRCRDQRFSRSWLVILTGEVFWKDIIGLRVFKGVRFPEFSMT